MTYKAHTFAMALNNKKKTFFFSSSFNVPSLHFLSVDLSEYHFVNLIWKCGQRRKGSCNLANVVNTLLKKGKTETKSETTNHTF